ncbi:MAG: hypothetical protein M1347_07530 [Chloroflexi bacterium]|nr:hypothetical protein [Chloroflexota bacterium]
MLLAAAFQIWSRHWHLLFTQQLNITAGQFDAAALWFSTFDIVLGIVSGALLAAAIIPKATGPRIPRAVIALGVLLPAIGLAIKLGTATGIYYPPLTYLMVCEWAVNSGLPPFWLGFTLGVLVKQLRTRGEAVEPVFKAKSIAKKKASAKKKK